jgi:hypothetical protein
MYTQYLNSYPIALHTIDEFRSDKRFQAFLATKRAKCGLDLMSYLIMPVQRVPRYQLLLKEIKRCTPQDHEEYAKLEEAYLKIQAIATHINESKRTVEGMSKLLEIQNRITGDFGQLLQPHRRLIREGVVSKLVPGIIQSQHIRKLFLFNDILLWTTNSNKFRGHLQLLGAKTIEIVDKKKYGFKLEPHTADSLSDSSHGTTPSDTAGGLSAGSDIKDKSGKAKPIIFFCKDEQEQKIWINDLREASSHLAETREAMKKRKDNAKLSKAKKATLKSNRRKGIMQGQPSPTSASSQTQSQHRRSVGGSFTRSETFSIETVPQPTTPVSRQSSDGYLTPNKERERAGTVSPLSPTTPLTSPSNPISAPIPEELEDVPTHTDLPRRSSF